MLVAGRFNYTSFAAAAAAAAAGAVDRLNTLASTLLAVTQLHRRKQLDHRASQLTSQIPLVSDDVVHRQAARWCRRPSVAVVVNSLVSFLAHRSTWLHFAGLRRDHVTDECTSR